MDRHVIIENFWKVGFGGDKSLATEDLGWSESIKRDAQTDYPEYIFRYVVEQVGFNILFYWVKDRNFHTIETERTPIATFADAVCPLQVSMITEMKHSDRNDHG